MKGARRLTLLLAGAVSMPILGCGEHFDLGSDVLWTSLFEGGNFDEWTAVPGGSADLPSAPPDVAEIAMDHPHGGNFAAKLTIDTSAGTQESIGLSRRGLPVEAYYSAWYYLPRTVAVVNDGFWVIFKFRRRSVADDQTSEGELFDVDLVQTSDGEMTVQFYDHRVGSALPLDVPSPVVPVGVWFQIEAYYRNASDGTGRATFWLNGQLFIDLKNQTTSPTSWVEWVVVNLGRDLNPSVGVLFVDDCAISRTQVGPAGEIVW